MRRFLSGLAVGALVSVGVVAALLPHRAESQARKAVPPAPEQPAERPDGQAGEPDSELAVRITPEMVRYSNTRYALYFAGTLLNALSLVFLLRSGISARLRDLAERKTRNRFLQACIYFPLLTLAQSTLLLPLAFYSGFVLPHQYGLSTETFRGWVADGVKGYAIGSALGSPVIALLYWTLRRSPQRWWVGFWVASIPLLLLTLLLGPILIEPLFNRFEPLKNERLRDRILAVAAEAGIERGRVFEVDASRRTKAVNAYVTGLGGSARIVLWDTLLQRLDEDEVVFVMAHEMGHYVERHVPILLGISITGSFVVLWLADRATRELLARRGEAWRVRGLDDLASLPALMLVVALVNFFGSPVESSLSRTLERRADDFGLRLTGAGRAAASGLIKLSELNLSHPDPPPFIKFWMFSHPPLKERIEHALSSDR